MKTIKRTEEIFQNCQFRGDRTKHCIVVEDLTAITVFDSELIELHKKRIEKKLKRKKRVLKIFNEKTWTKKHEELKKIYRLGVAIGKIKPSPFKRTAALKKIAI